MPTELDDNRLIRLHAIDQILSSEKKGVTMNELIERVTEITDGRVRKDKKVNVNRFSIKRDLEVLSDMGHPTDDSNTISVHDKKNRQDRHIQLIRYEDPDSSLFKVDLTADEKKFLEAALGMLGLKGISSMKVFRNLNSKIDSKSKLQRWISFTKNPIEKQVSKYFDEIFTAIRLKDVIQVWIKDRKPPYTVRKHTVSPWYLHEYNRRWYMFGLEEESQQIKRYSLDQMTKKPKVMTGKTYAAPLKSMDEILYDVVGVAVEDGEVLDVLFWVSDDSADYVSQKPLHHSQTEQTLENTAALLGSAPPYDGGKYFSIQCKENYELRRELLSFGPALVVLTPEKLRNTLKDQLTEMLERYR